MAGASTTIRFEKRISAFAAGRRVDAHAVADRVRAGSARLPVISIG